MGAIPYLYCHGALDSQSGIRKPLIEGIYGKVTKGSSLPGDLAASRAGRMQ